MNCTTYLPLAIRFIRAHRTLAALCLPIFIAGCSSHGPTIHTMMEQYTPPSGGEKAPAFSTAAENDAYLQKLLTSNAHKAEARGWLIQIEKDNKRRVIGSEGSYMKSVESLDFVNGLYSAGAVVVTAIDLETDPNVEGTSTLIVELSTNPASRAEVLKIEAKTAKELSREPTPDRGQKYVMFHWN